MTTTLRKLSGLCALILLQPFCAAQTTITNFNSGWRFSLTNDSTASEPGFNDATWRQLDLPHDWSIEGSFSDKYLTTFNQGALPAGIGWYRKTFTLPAASQGKLVSIHFDGVYRSSEVWINGHYLGKRASGYVSFNYDLTRYLKFGTEPNVMAVKVDNSLQPNSRWYTGSGIYRKVWLETTQLIHFDRENVFLTTPTIDGSQAVVEIKTPVTQFMGHFTNYDASLQTVVYDMGGKAVASFSSPVLQMGDEVTFTQKLRIVSPKLWSVDRPYLYRLVCRLKIGKDVMDEYTLNFGIRSFHFDAEKGFFLNNKPLKILGVCNHHDLGALGAAFNTRAAERQLEILKAMGCNAIRTAHNPPAPELLDLCDRMGFLVMDEAFDMWKKRKNRFDYNVDFNEWHVRDLEDMVRRDRNHPSVIIWSIGNEIREQFDSTGRSMARELVNIVKALDSTRPVTCALTENVPAKNFIYQSGALDILGFNYKQDVYSELPKRFPGQKFIATETASALSTRGYYEMPSDSFRIWPPDSKSKKHGNADGTVSAYDNTFAYWGDTHENSWKAVKKYAFIAGVFVWAGFDFMGEPVPYEWPSRSSYYGIVDLAGFPKDVYYMYQSEWTQKPVLHVFPHWNWTKGKAVDVWAYYNNADEVELFLNNRSLGVRKKTGDSLHVMWRVNYQPGTLRAVSRKNGKPVLTKETKTAGAPAKLVLRADRKIIKANGEDLSFITVDVTDKDGNIVPDANNLIRFTVSGGVIAGVDNGDPVSMEPFTASQRKAFHGKCLVIVRANKTPGGIKLTASSQNLSDSSIFLKKN